MANDGLKRVGERLDYYSDYRGDKNKNNPKFKSEWGKGFIKPYRSSNLENYVVMGLSAAGIAAGGVMTGVGLNITSGISSKLKETMDSNASTVNSAAAKVLEQMGINQDDAKKLAQWQADLNTVMYGRIEEGSPITLELYIIKDGKIVGTETKTFETSLLQDQEELDNLAKQWDAAGFEERAEIDKQIDEVTKRIADKDGLLDRAKLPDVSTETKGQIENVVAEELDVPKTMAKGKALTGVGATLMGVSALIEIYQIISFIVKLNNGYRLLQGANTNNDGISIIKDKKKAIVKTSREDDDRVLLKASDNPDEYRYSKAGYYQYGKTVPGEQYEGGRKVDGHSWVVAGDNEPADDDAALTAKDIQDVEENYKAKPRERFDYFGQRRRSSDSDSNSDDDPFQKEQELKKQNTNPLKSNIKIIVNDSKIENASEKLDLKNKNNKKILKAAKIQDQINGAKKLLINDNIKNNTTAKVDDINIVPNDINARINNVFNNLEAGSHESEQNGIQLQIISNARNNINKIITNARNNDFEVSNFSVALPTNQENINKMREGIKEELNKAKGKIKNSNNLQISEVDKINIIAKLEKAEGEINKILDKKIVDEIQIDTVIRQEEKETQTEIWKHQNLEAVNEEQFSIKDIEAGINKVFNDLVAGSHESGQNGIELQIISNARGNINQIMTNARKNYFMVRNFNSGVELFADPKHIKKIREDIEKELNKAKGKIKNSNNLQISEVDKINIIAKLEKAEGEINKILDKKIEKIDKETQYDLGQKKNVNQPHQKLNPIREAHFSINALHYEKGKVYHNNIVFDAFDKKVATGLNVNDINNDTQFIIINDGLRCNHKYNENSSFKVIGELGKYNRELDQNLTIQNVPGKIHQNATFENDEPLIAVYDKENNSVLIARSHDLQRLVKSGVEKHFEFITKENALNLADKCGFKKLKEGIERIQTESKASIDVQTLTLNKLNPESKKITDSVMLSNVNKNNVKRKPFGEISKELNKKNLDQRSYIGRGISKPELVNKTKNKK